VLRFLRSLPPKLLLPGFLLQNRRRRPPCCAAARMSGAPRVVATLWEIDDRTTAEVMKRFYEGMLARGERPAAALRAAQVAMWKNKGWDAPYYWAAFTLQGEWR
jgi:CHAT domain-containing protein